MKKSALIILLLVITTTVFAQQKIWTVSQANTWYKQQLWLVGADFLPSTAINQLELWQAETFDAPTIDKELGWAQNIGMNVMRVYLHDLAWKADATGFKKRIDTFLSIATKHNIKILFCILMIAGTPMQKLVHNLCLNQAYTIPAGYAAPPWSYIMIVHNGAI